jgi:hypothetical protein
MLLRNVRAFAIAVGVSMTCLGPLPAIAQLAVDPAYVAQMEKLLRGVNGYVGPLTLSRVPLTVTPAPVRYEGTSTTYASTFSTPVRLEGSVQRQGANLVFKHALFDERVSATLAAVVVRIVADAAGQVSNRELSFPAYARAPQDGQTRAMTAMFGRMMDAQVADSTRPHEAVLDALWQSKDDIAKTMIAGLPPGPTIAINTIEEKVAGLTTHQGRRVVVLLANGMMELRVTGATLTMVLKGYRLIDIETGLEVESMQGLTSNNVVGGQAQPTSAIVTVTTRTIRPA